MARRARLRAARGDLAAGTLRRYEELVRTPIEVRLGKELARNIDRFAISRFVEQRRADGFAPSTCELVLKVLGQLFEYALEHGLHGYNPVVEFRRQVRPQRGACRPLAAPALAEHELERLVTAAAPAWQLAFTLVTVTGLRTGELLGLRWRDLEGGAVTVRGLRRPDGAFAELPPLDPRRRTLVLSESLAPTLQVALPASPFSAPADPVFSGPDGKRRTPRGLDLAFTRACTRAGLDARLTVASLRWLFAERLISAGAPCASIAEQLGHGSFESTYRAYEQLFKQAGRLPEARAARRSLASEKQTPNRHKDDRHGTDEMNGAQAGELVGTQGGGRARGPGGEDR